MSGEISSGISTNPLSPIPSNNSFSLSISVIITGDSSKNDN